MAKRDEIRARAGSADRVAADWVARRDRGLTAAEQDDYLQWLQEEPRHGTIIARHEATLRRMTGLASWQPVLSQEANPDLFAPRRRARSWVLAALAAAAAVTLGLSLWRPAPASPVAQTAPSGNYLRVNERKVLDDGSVVELRDGSHIEVQFSATERRVRLIGGEAHFTVAKNPNRPFIVEAGGIAVRAIGTAFNVRLDAASVDVLVTEGRVNVGTVVDSNQPFATSAVAPVLVAASQRTVVPLAPAAVEPEVVSVTPAQVQQVLGWQAPRLQFHETPLSEAVAEFNRHNPRQIVLGDPGLGTVPIGGTFRIDNVEGFVRLLEITLGIRGEVRGTGEIVLLRAR